MRAVVGGTVTAVEQWNYVNKQTGEQVQMQSAFFASGRSVDKVAVPLTLGALSVGDTAHFVADVSVDSGRVGKDGKPFPASLSCWAKGLYEYDADPFAQTPANAPKAVKAVAN